MLSVHISAWLLIVPIFGIFTLAWITEARLPGRPTETTLGPVIDIVMRTPAETVSLLYDSEGGTRNMIIMDLFPHLHDQPKIGRPDLYAYRPDRLTERLDAGRDVFVLANGNTLAEIDSEGIPAPICSWAFGDRNLAYWGARPEICA